MQLNRQFDLFQAFDIIWTFINRYICMYATTNKEPSNKEKMSQTKYFLYIIFSIVSITLLGVVGVFRFTVPFPPLAL